MLNRSLSRRYPLRLAICTSLISLVWCSATLIAAASDASITGQLWKPHRALDTLCAPVLAQEKTILNAAAQLLNTAWCKPFLAQSQLVTINVNTLVLTDDFDSAAVVKAMDLCGSNLETIRQTARQAPIPILNVTHEYWISCGNATIAMYNNIDERYRSPFLIKNTVCGWTPVQKIADALSTIDQ